MKQANAVIQLDHYLSRRLIIVGGLRQRASGKRLLSTLVCSVPVTLKNFLVIDPDECIDCAACVPECPADAIFADDELPARTRSLAPL